MILCQSAAELKNKTRQSKKLMQTTVHRTKLTALKSSWWPEIQQVPKGFIGFIIGL